ncbi:germ cell-specific gene 1-like protein [Coregonus clupeaformis]|uniref:germ cell-specific gene 1-like protein n=1 Tax=Coregonus clupeaformis TaxID=59861 RepID=UPI001E1C969E|nr:germ cell-specific gene 1-like protein [Coregonus clupeaformis]
MSFLSRVRSPKLTFFQTLVSLVLGAMALLSSYWCEGSQKVPKPLCSANKLTKCIPVPGVSHNSTSIQFSWETGDDRFVFPAFHAGMWMSCEENIYTDAWEEKCRSFLSLTPGGEKGMLWLSVSMELMYVGLLCISCVLLSLQLCLDAFWPSQRWGQLLNAYSAVFTILGGLLGMVAHMMFMQVFQTTASMGPEDFKPHSYSYSWAFYVAWLAFTCCMLSGVSTLNNYTKKAVMERRRKARLYPPRFPDIKPLLPPAPCYCPLPPHPCMSLPSAELSPPSPYFDPPSPPPPSSPRPLTHSLSLPHCYTLPHPEYLPPPPSHPAPLSPYHRHSLPSPSISLPLYVHSYIPQYYSEDRGRDMEEEGREYSDEEYSPL